MLPSRLFAIAVAVASVAAMPYPGWTQAGKQAMTLTEAHFNIAGGAWDDNAVRLVAKEAQKGTKFWKEDVLEFAFKHRSPESLPEGQGSLAKLLYSRWKANPGNYLDSLDLKTEQAGATLDAAASAFKTDGSKAASSALKADASNTAVETTKSSGSRITKLKDTFQGWKSKLSNLRTGTTSATGVTAQRRDGGSLDDLD